MHRKIIYVLIVAWAFAMLLGWAALHTIAWLEPPMPVTTLYDLYLTWGGPLSFAIFAEIIIGLFLIGVFPCRSQLGKWDAILWTVFGSYFFWCLCQGHGTSITHTANGWFGAYKGRGHVLTEAQAIQGIWAIVKASSTLAIGVSLGLCYAFTVSASRSLGFLQLGVQDGRVLPVEAQRPTIIQRTASDNRARTEHEEIALASISDRKEFRACRSSYVVVGVLHAAMVALLLGLAFRKGWDSNVLLVLAALFLSWTMAYIWLSRFRLMITAQVVSYSSHFSPKKIFQRTEITYAGMAKTAGSFESPLTFSIRTKNGEEIRINTKVFSLGALRKLNDLTKESKATPSNRLDGGSSSPGRVRKRS